MATLSSAARRNRAVSPVRPTKRETLRALRSRQLERSLAPVTR
jgi:hypothetical protein